MEDLISHLFGADVVSGRLRLQEASCGPDGRLYAFQGTTSATEAPEDALRALSASRVEGVVVLRTLEWDITVVLDGRGQISASEQEFLHAA